MLWSLARWRRVAAISYGCIGFSNSNARIARPSGFETRLRFFLFDNFMSQSISYPNYPDTNILCQVYAAPHPSGRFRPVLRQNSDLQQTLDFPLHPRYSRLNDPCVTDIHLFTRINFQT